MSRSSGRARRAKRQGHTRKTRETRRTAHGGATPSRIAYNIAKMRRCIAVYMHTAPRPRTAGGYFHVVVKTLQATAAGCRLQTAGCSSNTRHSHSDTASQRETATRDTRRRPSHNTHHTEVNTTGSLCSKRRRRRAPGVCLTCTSELGSVFGHRAGGSRNPTWPHENGGGHAADPAEQHLALGRLDTHDGALIALAK